MRWSLDPVAKCQKSFIFVRVVTIQNTSIMGPERIGIVSHESAIG